MIALADTLAHPGVHEAEYRRLLGYPSHHVVEGRARELMGWARSWYAAHGRPWVFQRDSSLVFHGTTAIIDGHTFESGGLRDHLRGTGSRRVVLVAASAGPECEAEAARLWEAGRPDEYFFLEAYGAAVVEHVMAAASSRICDAAAAEGFAALPHYSPGYTGWDVAEQVQLFALLPGPAASRLPGPLAVLDSGMLRPRKSQIAVVGLAPAGDVARSPFPDTPCARCSWSSCVYRRAPYRSSPVRIDGAPSPRPAKPGAPSDYRLHPRVLAKWAAERTAVELQADGTTTARFRFDGTTCSSMGRPLAFDYEVRVRPMEGEWWLREATCRPATDDTGHRAMCAYLADASALMTAIHAEVPPRDRPLRALLAQDRPATAAGCLCEASSRRHKWGLALEVIHFALTHPGAAPTLAHPSPTPFRP